MNRSTPRKPGGRGRMWSLVFALNMVVPLLFGWEWTAENARLGMAAGVGLLWYLGYRACRLNDGLGRALVYGGFLIAVTQFLPILQVWSGLVGVSIASALERVALGGPGIGETLHTALGGLIATGLTGLLLMGMAGVCGAIIVWATSRPPRVAPKAGSLLYDRQLDG